MNDKSPVRILIVDDDEDDFFITSEYVKNIAVHYSFTIDWCFKYQEALNKICEGKYDIYFVDYNLGAKTGLDLIKDGIKTGCEEPIILLTGKGSQKIDVEAMQAGAVDYLVKSELNTEKLERCIRYALGRYEFIKALKANEQKFRSIFEKSHDAVFVANARLDFKDVNPATSEIFEYTKDELLSLSFFDLLANKKDEAVFLEQLSLQHEVDNKEVELVKKSKEKITCIVSASKEKDIRGDVYVQGIIHDITNLKKSEKTTLQTEKFKAAERLVHTLAHEVRNPLNNINLSLEQLNAEMADKEAATYLDIISRNSRRIGDLITELLDSSKATEIVLEKISLQSALDESIAAASDRINLKKIKLQLYYGAEPAYIMADPAKLKIVFLNIIINAIEAMNEDEGSLVISMVKEDFQQTVFITDNGTGISEENIQKLFEPYYTTKRNGMGLGLASALNILQSHKALIDVKSKPGAGTSFSITFKAA